MGGYLWGLSGDPEDLCAHYGCCLRLLVRAFGPCARGRGHAQQQALYHAGRAAAKEGAQDHDLVRRRQQAPGTAGAQRVYEERKLARVVEPGPNLEQLLRRAAPRQSR